MPSKSIRQHLTVWECPGNPAEVPLLGLWLRPDGLRWLGDPSHSSVSTPGLDIAEALEASVLNLGGVLAGKALEDWNSWSKALPLESGLEDELKAEIAEDALEVTLPSLKQICSQPRSHLRSDERCEALSRVRKMSPRALPLLAARSEDWQGRTFRGVRPSRLLAANNEDDWEIYENRAVVTLHRRLVAAFSIRVTRLRALLAQIEAAEEAGRTNMVGSWRRRHRLTRLLGEVFKKPPQADEVRALCDRLTTMLRRLRSMESSFLIKTLRHARGVQSPLLQTNLLCSDLAYRKAARLWEHWMNRKEIVKLSRREIRSRLIDSHQRFARTLIVRALTAMGLAPIPGAQTKDCIYLNRGWQFKTVGGGSIELWRNKQCLLRIVPIVVDWRKLSEGNATRWWACLARLAAGTPTLCLSLYDGLNEDSAKWSDSAIRLFQDAESFGFLTTGLGLISASPRQLDSGESVLRFVRTVVHRAEWPLLPIFITLAPAASAQGIRAELPATISLQDGSLRFEAPPTTADMAKARQQIQASILLLQQLRSHLENLELQIRDHSIDGSIRARLRAEKGEVLAKIADEVRRQESRQIAAGAMNEASEAFQIACICPYDHHHLGKLTSARTYMCEECKTEWGRMSAVTSHPAFILPKGLTGMETPNELIQLWGADVITPVHLASNGRVGPTAC